MLGMTCKFNRDQHVILHHEILDWTKRQALPKDRVSLFLYFQRYEHTFVIAKWIKPGEFVDILNLGTMLTLSREDAHWLREQLSVNYKGIDVAAIKAGYNRVTTFMQNENDDELEYRKQRYFEKYC